MPTYPREITLTAIADQAERIANLQQLFSYLSFVIKTLETDETELSDALTRKKWIAGEQLVDNTETLIQMCADYRRSEEIEREAAETNQ